MSTEVDEFVARMRTDRVFFEVLNNRLNGITSEMGHIIHKASYTPFIKEAWDFGEGLVSLGGEMFSYPRDIGVAFMVAALMDDAVRAFDDYRPGDLVITNDPRTTGGLCTHLPDIHLLKPFFHGNELVCFLWTFIHSSDVGGLVPGSIAPSAYDLYQEGLILPPTKLYNAGVLNEELKGILLANSRIPVNNWGDLTAMLSAMEIGERRLRETIERYGLQRFKDGAEDLLGYGEARAREIIRRIPDGEYTISDYMELDITGEPPSRIKLRLEIEGSSIHLDFSGTDPQVRAALNLPTFGKNHHFINAAVFNFLHAVDKSIPINRGMLRPVKVTIPQGSILNPEPHAAVGVRFATAVRVMDLVIGALSLAIDGDKEAPEDLRGRLPAAGAGVLGVVLLSLIDHRSGEMKVNVIQPMWGGSGARPVKDGIDGADFAAGFLRNIPAETSEAEMPILVRRYELAADAPAAGKWRGGLGVDLEFQTFAPNAILTARGMERYQFRPWGRRGGGPGTLGRTIVNPGTNSEESVGKIFTALHLDPGQVVRIVTPGGGGYGDPQERHPDRVLRDVRDGLVSEEDAETVYGVAIVDDAVDVAATEALRRRAEPDRPVAEFVGGPERSAFEDACPEEAQDAIAELLADIAPSQRQYWRTRLLAEVESISGDRPGAEDIAALFRRLRSEAADAVLR